MRAPDPCANPMPIPFVLAAVLTAAAPDPMTAPIVAAENNFSADARRYGLRLAFLAHFDAGSWLFRPYPVPALDALARDGDDGSALEWGPEIVGVAASGDLGFTSGPWSAHAPGTDTLAHGHFLTIWKRGEDGIWRVQVDGGIRHAALAAPVAAVTMATAAAAGVPLDTNALARRRHALEAADDSLRAALAEPQRDTAALWRKAADPDWRAMRPKEMPATGDAAFALVAKDPARRGSGARRAFDVASSGDLAWSIGGDATCKECGSDYRVWRWHDGGWRVMVDLATP
jgi:hypothetical protein